MGRMRSIAITAALAIMAIEASPSADAQMCEMKADQTILAPDPAARDLFGWVVALQGDWAFVADNRARLFIFRLDNSGTPSNPADDVWVLHDLKTETRGDAIATGGKRVAVGDSAGQSVVVLERDERGTPLDPSDDLWSAVHTLVPPDGDKSVAFGFSVSVDGDRVLVGDPGNNGEFETAGAAFIFRLDTSGQWILEAKLVGAQPVVPDQGGRHFGRAVSLQGDEALIGASGEQGHFDGAGAVFVFRFDGADWIEKQIIRPPPPSHRGNFGRSISRSGDTVFIESRFPGVYAFDFDGTEWIERQLLEAPPFSTSDNPSISGEWAIVRNGVASVYLFFHDGCSWVQKAMLTPPDPLVASGHFGRRMWIDGERIIVGAPESGVPGQPDIENAGAVVFFSLLDVDCGGNGVLDGCEPDCNENGVADSCDVVIAASEDCTGNGVPDECEPDCNGNNIPDSCDIAAGELDCNDAGNGIPDVCEPDCNANGVSDTCDIDTQFSDDCNRNRIPDECEGGAISSEGCRRLAIRPVSATGGVAANSGNSIEVVAGGVVELNMFISDWAEIGDGTIRRVAFKIDGSTYSNGVGAPLTPVGSPCTCIPPNGNTCDEGGFVLVNMGPVTGCNCSVQHCEEPPACVRNPDYVFFELLPSGTVTHADLDFEYMNFAASGARSDDDTEFYCGTLRLEIPLDAEGTYTIDLLDDPAVNFVEDGTRSVFPIGGITPATIVVLPQGAKSRFLSIDPGDAGSEPVALRVDLLNLACSSTGKKCTTLRDCKACVGGQANGLACSIGSDCPGGVCENSAETCDELGSPVALGWVGDPVLIPEDATARIPADTYHSLVVASQPSARVWTEAVVHIGDCEIAPDQTYAISAMQGDIVVAAPLIVATTPKPAGKFWGDVVGSFQDGVWTRPNGIVNVNDVLAWINFKTNKPAPHVTVLDLDGEVPNFVINASDLGMILQQGFQGLPYPPPAFANQGGPTDCP